MEAQTLPTQGVQLVARKPEFEATHERATQRVIRRKTASLQRVDSQVFFVHWLTL